MWWSKASSSRGDNCQSSSCRFCTLRLCPHLEFKVSSLFSLRRPLSHIQSAVCHSVTYVTFRIFVLIELDCKRSFSSSQMCVHVVFFRACGCTAVRRRSILPLRTLPYNLSLVQFQTIFPPQDANERICVTLSAIWQTV